MPSGPISAACRRSPSVGGDRGEVRCWCDGLAATGSVTVPRTKKTRKCRRHFALRKRQRDQQLRERRRDVDGRFQHCLLSKA